MLVSENRRSLHEKIVARRHLGFQVVSLYMVSFNVPLAVYANIAGSFTAFDNHVCCVTSKVSLFNDVVSLLVCMSL